MIKFRVYPFNPLIYIAPQTVSITLDTGEEIGSIVCPKTVCGSLTRVLVCVGLAFGIEYLLMNMLVNFGFTGKIVTLAPMTVFLVLLIILPWYLLPKPRLQIMLKKRGNLEEVGFISPTKFQIPFFPRYTLFNSGGEFVVTIGKNMFFNEFSCVGCKEHLLVIPDDDIVATSVMGFGDSLRDNTFSFGQIIDAILNYAPFIKDFSNSLKGKQNHNGFLIFGKNSIKLAHFMAPEFAWRDKDMHCQLTIDESDEHQRERLLPVFLGIAIVVSGY